MHIISMPNFAPRAACFASRERNNRWRLFLSARQQKQHTHRPLSSQRACKNLFCQYIYLGERRLQNKGEGQTPVRSIAKKMCRSRHPRPLGRRFPAQQLDYADCLATSFLPAALCVLSAGLPFFTCLRLRRWLRPAATVYIYTENNQVKLP